jgi:Bacterial Ig-like domain/Dockerin type I domain
VNPADTTPPLVTASGFVYETSPHRITMTFSEDVQATLAAPDLLVQKLGEGGGATSLPTLDYSAATRTATFSFSSYPGGQLPDGNYRATIPAGAVADAAGNPMAAFTLDFFVLAGDLNRDRFVNGADFSILAANFGKSGQTYADGDVTGDGSVNGSDFSVLAANFGKALPAPEAPTAAVTGQAGVSSLQARTPARAAALPRSPKPRAPHGRARFAPFGGTTRRA